MAGAHFVLLLAEMVTGRDLIKFPLRIDCKHFVRQTLVEKNCIFGPHESSQSVNPHQIREGTCGWTVTS